MYQITGGYTGNIYELSILGIPLFCIWFQYIQYIINISYIWNHQQEEFYDNLHIYIYIGPYITIW